MRVIVGLVLLVLLTSCANDLDGEVSSKDVDPGYVVLMPILVGKVTVLTPFYIPACYEIHVSGAESGSTCLEESQWEDIQVGDPYQGPDIDPEDRKERRD